MKTQNIIIIFIITLFIGQTISTSFSQQLDNLDCDYFGERVTLGDYYSSNNNSDKKITVAVNTRDNCEQFTSLKLIKNDKVVEIIEPFTTKLIDVNKYTNGKVNYQIYSYFFTISNVEEGEIFYYTISNENQFKVKVPLKQNQLNYDSILVYGDYDANVQELQEGEDNFGQYTHEYFMRQAQNNTQFDTMLFLGDLAYDIKSDNYKRSEQFFKKITPYYASIPTINTYGNHESGGSGEEYQYRYVNDYFYMPDYDKGKNRDFEFDTQYAQFINFDAKFLWYGEDEKDQQRVLDNLETQLKKAVSRRSEKPWIIVYTHYPVFFTSEDDTVYSGQFKKTEEILEKYNVDLYLSAHVHAYQRYSQDDETQWQKQKLSNKEIINNPKFTQYIVEGTGGQAHVTKKTKFFEGPNQRSQDFGKAGASYLKIFNSTHLSYQHFRTQTEEVTDEFWIIKDLQKEITLFNQIINYINSFF